MVPRIWVVQLRTGTRLVSSSCILTGNECTWSQLYRSCRYNSFYPSENCLFCGRVMVEGVCPSGWSLCHWPRCTQSPRLHSYSPLGHMVMLCLVFSAGCPPKCRAWGPKAVAHSRYVLQVIPHRFFFTQVYMYCNMIGKGYIYIDAKMLACNEVNPSLSSNPRHNPNPNPTSLDAHGMSGDFFCRF